MNPGTAVFIHGKPGVVESNQGGDVVVRMADGSRRGGHVDEIVRKKDQTGTLAEKMRERQAAALKRVTGSPVKPNRHRQARIDAQKQAVAAAQAEAKDAETKDAEGGGDGDQQTEKPTLKL